MFDRIKGIYMAVARWVHRQNQIVSSISHLVICLVGVAGAGSALGGLMLLAQAPPLAIDGVLGALMLTAAVLYGAREERNRREKGFRQAARDGDTLFGPDFLLAVAGSVAGFTIARAILGL